MSDDSRCCFCQKLPAVRGRWVGGGSPARCPLCKGELLRTAAATYRYEPSSWTEKPRTDSRRLLRGACGLASVLVFLVTGSLLVKFSTLPRRSPPLAASPIAQRT